MTGEKNYLQLTEKKIIQLLCFLYLFISASVLFLALRKISAEGARNK